MSRNLLPEIARQKSYQPVNWTARHRNCIALEMAGFKPKEICEILGWKIAKVSVTLNDARADLERTDLAGRIIDKMTDVHVQLHLLSNEAVEQAADIMRYSENDGVKLKAAFGILDRAGYSTVHKILNGSEGVELPDETLDRMEEVVAELDKHSKTYHTPEPAFEEAEEAEFEVVG